MTVSANPRPHTLISARGSFLPRRPRGSVFKITGQVTYCTVGSGGPQEVSLKGCSQLILHAAASAQPRSTHTDTSPSDRKRADKIKALPQRRNSQRERFEL